MFDLGLGEIVISLLLVLIFVPVKDLPILAHKVGKMYQKGRILFFQWKNRGLNLYQELTDNIEDLEKLKKQTEEKITKIKKYKNKK